MINKIAEIYNENEFIKFDGFDNAIIGIDDINMKLIYSTSKCIEILIIKMGFNEDEAIDYFYYNLKSIYFGDKTPIFCIDDF